MALSALGMAHTNAGILVLLPTTHSTSAALFGFLFSAGEHLLQPFPWIFRTPGFGCGLSLLPGPSAPENNGQANEPVSTLPRCLQNLSNILTVGDVRMWSAIRSN